MATSIFAELHVVAGPGAAPDLVVTSVAAVRMRGRGPFGRGHFQGDSRRWVNN